MAPAPGKGRGVFAAKDIARDEVIERSPFIYIDAKDDAYLFATQMRNYTFNADDDKEGTAVALGFASMYNHSANPSAEWTMLDGIIMITSLRPIKENEEITMDYGWDEVKLKAMGIK